MVVLETSLENSNDYCKAKLKVESCLILRRLSLRKLSRIEEVKYENVIQHKASIIEVL